MSSVSSRHCVASTQFLESCRTQMAHDHLDFATLTPINAEAVSNFESVCDIVRKQPSGYKHHSLFLGYGLPVVDSQDLSTTLEQQSCSSDATTEIASCDGLSTAAQKAVTS